MDNIGDILRRSFGRLGIDSKLREYRVFRMWNAVVGESIAGRTNPSRLIGKTLHVTVSSPPWMHELQHLKETIKRDLNKRLVEDAVSDIVFSVGKVDKKLERTAVPVEHRPLSASDMRFIEKTVSAVKDEGLQTLILRTLEKYKSMTG